MSRLLLASALLWNASPLPELCAQVVAGSAAGAGVEVAPVQAAVAPLDASASLRLLSADGPTLTGSLSLTPGPVLSAGSDRATGPAAPFAPRRGIAPSSSGLLTTTRTPPARHPSRASAVGGPGVQNVEGRAYDMQSGPTRSELSQASVLRGGVGERATMGGRASPATGRADYAAGWSAWFDSARVNHADEPEAPAGKAPAPKPSDLSPGDGRDAKADGPVAAPQTPAPAETAAWRAATANLVTGLNLASGMVAAILAAQGLLLPAAGLILLANVFDALDGRVARALGVSSPMGIELDSLADVVSFGVAPGVLVLRAALTSLGPWGYAVAAVFAFAGAYRLARFNIGAQAERAGVVHAGKSDSFTGLPIPGGAGVLVALTFALGILPAAWIAPVAVVVTLLAAAAMVSRFPYPAFKKGGMKALAAPGAVAAAAALALTLAGLPALIPAAVFGLYLLTGPAVAIYQGGSEAFKKELKRKAFHQLTLLYLAAYFLVGHPLIVPLMGAWVAVVAIIEAIRLKVPAARPFFDHWFGKIIRGKEADRFSGSFYASLGVFLTMLLFGSNPALVAAGILFLVLGDAASPLVGLRVGMLPYKVMGIQRSVDGTVAGLLIALSIGLALGFPLGVALGAAVAFSLVDTFPVKPDDNLWIPVVGAAVLFLLSLL